MKHVLTMRYPTAWHGEMWREAAPCGNGTVGLLVYGGVHNEIIAVNHAGLWRDGCKVPLPDVSNALPVLRDYLDRKRPDLADTVLSTALKDAGYDASNCEPLPLGDIRITRKYHRFPMHYRRTVDMENAEVSVRWQEDDGTGYSRNTFASRADGLCYTRLSADRPGKISVSVAVSEHDRETLGNTRLYSVESTANGEFVLYAAANPDTAYEPARGDYGIVLRAAVQGGTVTSDGNELEINGADEVLLVSYVFAGRDRKTAFEEGIKALQRISSYEDALQAHTELHRAFFNTVDFTISGTEDRSNEELLLEAYEGELPNELAEKMYAFGRYLMICATGDRGELPVHLTGLWSGTYQSFWAIYMYNVNFEMIYWNALSGNLFGLMRGALDYVESFMEDYRENAKKLFGCRGIYIDSVNTPESGKIANMCNHILNWTGGAGWAAQHFYDYCRYTGDEAYLREHALPFMAEAALFYEDFLRIRENGKYEFAPSTSPENVSGTTYRLFHTDSSVQCSKNASMDLAIARELLTNLLEASDRTGLYAEKREKWHEMLELLPDYKFNSDGSLKEWADDFYDDNMEHRHQSHMYALFPGHTVTTESQLFPAFKLAEENRLNVFPAAASSWSMIYMTGAFARMRDGEKAYRALTEMVRNCCMNNLFTVHNDWRRMGSVMCDDFQTAPFQIDANIGFPAVVNEMLLNSSDGRCILFPALPDEWKQGHLNGVRAVGGHTLILEWNAERATVHVRLGADAACLICGPGWHFADGTTETMCKSDCTVELIRM